MYFRWYKVYVMYGAASTTPISATIAGYSVGHH